MDEGESRPHANGGQERSPDKKKKKKKIKGRTGDVIEIQEGKKGKKKSKDRNKTPEKVKKKKLKVEHHEDVVERASKAVSPVEFILLGRNRGSWLAVYNMMSLWW